jgi:hypothetical protein
MGQAVAAAVRTVETGNLRPCCFLGFDCFADSVSPTETENFHKPPNTTTSA